MSQLGRIVSVAPQKNLPFREIRERQFPDELSVQTQTRCNGRCVMCPYPAVEEEITHGRMSWKLFARIIDETSHHLLLRLKLHLMNEPLLDTRLPAFAQYARERLPRTRIGFVTNGLLLKGKMAKQFMHGILWDTNCAMWV